MKATHPWQSISNRLTERCVINPIWSSILLMKISNRIQLSVPEISLIASSILARKPCNFLVFGMGNDSLFWKFLNRGGQTLFLEDNPHWYQRISQKHPHLNAHLVQYNTKRSQWKDLLSKPADLGFPLPQEVEEIPWDVILVDAPNGWRNDQPGRMKSIYHASKLIRPGGDVFVHDCNRTIERIYSSTFLGNENLVASIGRLRMFCIG